MVKRKMLVEEVENGFIVRLEVSVTGVGKDEFVFIVSQKQLEKVFDMFIQRKSVGEISEFLQP